MTTKKDMEIESLKYGFLEFLKDLRMILRIPVQRAPYEVQNLLSEKIAELEKEKGE